MSQPDVSFTPATSSTCVYRTTTLHSVSWTRGTVLDCALLTSPLCVSQCATTSATLYALACQSLFSNNINTADEGSAMAENEPLWLIGEMDTET